MIPGIYDSLLVMIAIYREARNQSDAAKRGVAWVIRNRVEHPCWWGHDIYTVLFKLYQFTSMSLKGDPNLLVFPNPTEIPALNRIVLDVWDSSVIDPTGGATHYHDKSIPKPLGWGPTIVEMCRIGDFTFYRQT
jgi:N-acetylmuramoyl-L-alanine amidase